MALCLVAAGVHNMCNILWFYNESQRKNSEDEKSDWCIHDNSEYNSQRLAYSCKLANKCLGIVISEHSDNLTGKFIFSYNNGRLIYYYKKRLELHVHGFGWRYQIINLQRFITTKTFMQNITIAQHITTIFVKEGIYGKQYEIKHNR